jgi:hypothetical protein
LKKKSRELPLYVFKDLEIRNYIERVLETYGIILHNYKQHYNGSTLNLYVSYFVTPDFMLNKKGTVDKLTIKNSTGKTKVVGSLDGRNRNLDYLSFHETTTNLVENPSRLYKLKKYLGSEPYAHVPQDKVHQKFNEVNSKINGVFEQVFEVLNLFGNNRLDITLNLCCINKDLYFLKFSQEKFFLSLQKFRNTPFFKEGIELLFHVAYNSNSAHLLAKFIAFQFKKIKRQKFFLSFLKQSLTILLNSSPSKIKGVKIVVKGRLNGVPRAKQKMIVVGDVPTQSISAKLDYAQTTIHNSNGSHGIQVWVVEK